MKQLFILLLLSTILKSQAQNKLPIIKATSAHALIYKKDEPPYNWTINPKIKLDVHFTEKLVKTSIIRLKTDVDAISFPQHFLML